MIDYRTEAASPVIEVHVSGHVSDAELREVFTRLGGDLEAGKTRLLEVIEHFTGIEPSALWTDIKLGIPLANKVARVAIVADQSWIRAIAHLGGLFTKAEIQIFEPGQLEAARTWVAA